MPIAMIGGNGFTSSSGKFYAKTGNKLIERVNGFHLRVMFLPRLTAEASQLLKHQPAFVRGQLKHYGVEYDESEYSGNGTLLLTKEGALGWQGNRPTHRMLSSIVKFIYRAKI